MYILNVCKKVLGVIISVEVATHRPPILFLPVDGVLVDCCFSFTHGWIGMAPSYKEMSLEQWKRALGLLLSQSKDGVLPWGSLTIVTDEIGVACSTISRLWRQVCRAHEGSLIITPEIDLQNNLCTNLLKYSHAEFHQSLKETPQHHCKTYCSTVKALRVSLNTVQRMLLRRDVCHVHTSSLKPTLMDENKVSRMELALSFIDKNDTSKFEHMEDLIHIDEK